MLSRAEAAVKKPNAAAQAAAEAPYRDALAFFARERKWIDDQHMAICRVPAPTFREEKRAEFMQAQLKALGFDARLDRAGNMVATRPEDRTGERPLVALTAHLDTVLAPHEPGDIRWEDGRFLGPGVSDNGAGLAALVAIARAAAEFDLWRESPCGLLLVANVGEEGEGNLSGMRFLCRPSPFFPRIRSFLVLDGPATDHITAEALACRRFELQIQGPGGHSWSDFGTANPVNALCRAVSDFADLRAELGPQQARSSFNFGVIEGGSTINAIPAQARAKADLRAEDSGVLDQMVHQLVRTLERAAQLENDRARCGRVTARLRETGSRPGGKLPPDAPILAAIHAVDECLGIKSRSDCSSTDANVPLSLGMPAISIGAGGAGGGAHTPAEWYSSDGRDLGLRRILLMLALSLES